MYVDTSEHLPGVIRNVVISLNQATGLGHDQLRFVLFLLAAIPCGIIWNSLFAHANDTSRARNDHTRSNGFMYTLKHLVSLVVGLLFVYGSYGSSWVHVLAHATVPYIIVRLFPKSKRTPTAVFVFSIIYMSWTHIYRLYHDYMGVHLDWSTSQMVITAKVCTFAFNVQDGHCGDFNAHEIKDSFSDRAKGIVRAMNARRKAYAMTSMPSVLEYYSFVFFFGSVLVGPALEIVPFLRGQDPQLKADAPKPSVAKEIVWSIISIFLAYGLMQVYQIYFPVLGADKGLSSMIRTETVVHTIVYIALAAMISRGQFYFAWYLAELGCLASGIPPEYANNCDLYKVETGPSVVDLTTHWNKGINTWLKFYVYQRLPFSRDTNNLVTKMVSALWHGFYPGYYVFFFYAWVVTEVEEKLWRAFPVVPKFLRFIWLHVHVGVAACNFMVLSWENVVAQHYMTKFFVPISLFIQYALLVTVFRGRSKLRKKHTRKPSVSLKGKKQS